MTSLRRGFGLFSLISLAGVFSLPGCDLATSFQDVGSSLTNPDAALLDHPGRKLASGLFRQLLIDGSLDEGGHVIALRDRDGEQDLAIIPYLEDNPCYFKPAVAVDRLSSRVDVELPGILSVQGKYDDNGRGDVSFVDFECNEAIEGFSTSVLPQAAFPASKPRGLLGMTGAGELYLVEPKKKRTVFISEGASLARSSDDHLWSVEEGELVIRDADLDEVVRLGDGVHYYALTGGSGITAAFMDENGLSYWNKEDGVTLISESACSPIPWGADTLAYFDPCDARKLNIYTRGSRLGLDADYIRLVGPEGISDLNQHLSSDWGSGKSTSHLSFVVGEPGALEGEVHLARIPKEVELQGDGLTIELETEAMTKGNGTLRGADIFLDWDGVSGRLVEYEINDDEITGLLSIARDVAQLPGGSPFSPRGVLSDFDGMVGTLRLYEVTRGEDGKEISSEVLAHDVPIQSQVLELETDRLAFIGDSKDGSRGTLYLGHDADKNTPTRFDAIDDHVLLNTARFLEQPRGLAYLVRAPDSPEAQLRVWLIDSEIKLTVHENVHEYRTVPWPAPGILYAVPNGKDQGMWFSKAR